MSIHTHPFTEAQSAEACIDPAVGSLLPDYIVDLLEETAAEEVDKHLINCQPCKETYLAILRIRYAPREPQTVQVNGNGHVSNDAKVQKLVDYKTRRA